MNQKEYRDMQYQLGLVNVGDPGVESLTDIIETLLSVIRSQSIRIEALEQNHRQAVSKVDCRGANMSGSKGTIIAGTVIR